MNNVTNITVISDCSDGNAQGRQIARYASLLRAPIAYIGTQSTFSDLEVAGNLIDLLDAQGDREGIVVANAAPRHGIGKKWENGTPFCYFKYRNTHVLASIAGLTLSLVKKLNLTDSVFVVDLSAAVDQFIAVGLVKQEEKSKIVDSQFRSFDFLPFAAAFVAQKGLPRDGEAVFRGNEMPITDIADAPNAIWWVDNFGNCKTTLLKSKKDALLAFLASNPKYGTFTYFDRLKDVPNGTRAVTEGSSGIGANRFLEIIIQGESAAKELGIGSGSELVVK